MDRRTESTTPDAPMTSASVVAWDVPTRVFHWALVLLICNAYATRKWGSDLDWHKWNGYAVLILVVWRVLWGFCGTSTARFASFFYWPWQAARYGIDFALRRPRHFLGHNPLGGSVVFAMLGIVGALGVLGLFSYDDHTSNAGGPLAGKVSDAAWAFATKWHIRIFDLLLVVVALHVVANLLYLVWKRENLIKAMITGRKPRHDYEDASEARLASGLRAIVCLAIATAIVLGGIKLAGGRVF